MLIFFVLSVAEFILSAERRLQLLRQDIVVGVENIQSALSECELPILIEKIFRNREKKVENGGILASYTKYIKLSQKFGHIEADLAFFEQHVPKILHLLARESDNICTKMESGIESECVRLNVIVIEDTNISTPSRLLLMLEAVQGLYEAAAAISGQSSRDICVLSCDSGSDKSFDFIGLAKVMQCVKEIILSFWDKVVYFREDKTGKQLELIANSLPILERITVMKDDGMLEPERAELLRRQVVQSVMKFADAGVTIPEIEDFTTFSPRQLLHPAPKLLVAPIITGIRGHFTSFLPS